MKKIKGNLAFRIFILISILLVCVSGITYYCIARILPATYTNDLTERLRQVTVDLKKELEAYESIEDAQELLTTFEEEYEATIKILDENGDMVYPYYNSVDTAESVPEPAAEEIDASVSESAAEGVLGDNPTVVVEDIAQEIFVGDESEGEVVEQSWAHQSSRSWGDPVTVKASEVKINGESYTLLITGEMQAVSQAVEVLKKIVPYIVCIVLAVAFVCALAVSVYLTGLKETNQKLKDDMEREKEIERQRTAFFSAVSHELKTPVTILKGHIGGMLQNVGAYRDREYYLSRSYEVTKTMESMVQEILDVARMESAVKNGTRANVDLAEMVRLKAAELMELMDDKELQLNVEVPEHLYFMADEGLMCRVFSNLFVNAVRYTPKQGRIGAYLYQEGQDVLFRLENTSEPIPEESLHKLFDAFYRVEGSRNRETGGSGLGLYIVKMALEQHQGEYGAENIESGVRFWFRLTDSEKRKKGL